MKDVKVCRKESSRQGRLYSERRAEKYENNGKSASRTQEKRRNDESQGEVPGNLQDVELVYMKLLGWSVEALVGWCCSAANSPAANT
jgi:hypothetical protein